MESDPNRNGLIEIVEARAILDDRFTNIRRIDETGGNGNFSLIFAASDRQSDRDIVLKFYHPNQRHDSYRWACFQREAEILESLSGQRDIIGFVSGKSEFVESFPVGKFSLTVPFAYYGMELAASDMGITTAMGIWDSERLLCAFRSMCRSVQRIHRRGIAHRDLKPRNFLVSLTGDVKLSDFGTARQVEDGNIPALANVYNGPPGDLRYAAPELLACFHDEDPRISLRSDVFSLGAILFELFTGVTLVPLVLDQALLNDLTFLMARTKKAQRRAVFDGFVSSMASAHPLPDISAMGVPIPRCIVDRLDRLYKSMADLDYRSRLWDFERIFWQLETCLLILRNEEKFKKWRDEKRRRKVLASQKDRRSGVSQ